MKHKCPYCGGPLEKDPDLPVMRQRWMRIYKTAASAGPHGIPATDLLVRMYADEEWPTPGGNTVLRVQIHEINKRIAPYHQRIVSAFDGPGKSNTRYYLRSIGESQ